MLQRLNAAVAMLALLLASATPDVWASPPTAQGRLDTPQPAAIVQGLKGLADVQSDHGKRPVGPLMLLWQGEFVVVESGFVRVRDLRTSQLIEVLPSAPYRVPETKAPGPSPIPARIARLLDRLAFGAEDDWRVGGTRNVGDDSAWPDYVRLASDVPCLFEWSGSRRPNHLYLVRETGDTLSTIVHNAPSAERHVFRWPGSKHLQAGRYDWAVIDSTNERIAAGRFVVLDNASTDSLRGTYLARAQSVYAPDIADLAAALLAAEDGYLLW